MRARPEIASGGHARGDGEDVFRRAADFHAADVGGAIEPERLCRQRFAKALRRAVVVGREGHRRRQSLADVRGEAWTRQDRGARLRQFLRDDFAQESAPVALDALGADHDGRARRQMGPRRTQRQPQRLRRNDREHDPGALDAGKIGGRRDRMRDRQSGQMPFVLAIARKRGRMRRLMSPERDLTAPLRSDIGERDAPGPGAENCNPIARHLSNFPLRHLYSAADPRVVAPPREA